MREGWVRTRGRRDVGGRGQSVSAKFDESVKCLVMTKQKRLYQQKK